MDGMMGFDTVEYYFGDPQTSLKEQLAAREFVINTNARLEAGYTEIAIPAMTSPTFYDSYLANEFVRVSQLTRNARQRALNAAMAKKGFSVYDIRSRNELLSAFSFAGYLNMGNSLMESVDMNVRVEKENVVNDLISIRDKENEFSKIVDFKNLITDASAFSVLRSRIDKIIEKIRPVAETQLLPEYKETVEKHISEQTDSYMNMLYAVKAMKYATTIQTPHFMYFVNYKAHCADLSDSTVIGEIDYGRIIGRTFIYDEYGNIYKERLEDPNDVNLYLPQHKYAAKEMLAQIDVIIENDPDAVIVLQGDHGIHGIGHSADSFDSKFMFQRGYTLEDQLALNLSVISAVRIPPQYGKLTQPLDPLDIARYLVNHFVGEGNYDYLYYKEF
jgi:hypothetical protein